MWEELEREDDDRTYDSGHAGDEETEECDKLHRDSVKDDVILLEGMRCCCCDADDDMLSTERVMLRR